MFTLDAPRSTDRPFLRRRDRRTDRPTDRPIDRPIDRSIDRSTARSRDVNDISSAHQCVARRASHAFARRSRAANMLNRECVANVARASDCGRMSGVVARIARERATSRAAPRARRARARANAHALDDAYVGGRAHRDERALVIDIGTSRVTLACGKIGLQANGAIFASEGETVVYTTACASRECTGDGSFVPLTVNYAERFSAAGRTAGGYKKRDGGVRDSETLKARLVDRPIRPMMYKGWGFETQVLQWVMSYDGARSTDALAITAASAALAVSDIPLKKPVVGVRVGLLPGSKEPVINPTAEQMKTSRLDLVLAGTDEAVLMIEGFCDFLTTEEMLHAIEKGQEAVAKACKEIEAWAAVVGKPKMMDKLIVVPEGVDDAVEALVGGDLAKAMLIPIKQERGAAVGACRERAVEALLDKYKVGLIGRDIFCSTFFYSRLFFNLLRSTNSHRRFFRELIGDDSTASA